MNCWRGERVKGRRKRSNDERAGGDGGCVGRVVERGDNVIRAGIDRAGHRCSVSAVGDGDGQAGGKGCRGSRLDRSIVGLREAAQLHRCGSLGNGEVAGAGTSRVGVIRGEARADSAGIRAGVEAGQADTVQGGHSARIGRGRTDCCHR